MDLRQPRGGPSEEAHAVRGVATKALGLKPSEFRGATTYAVHAYRQDDPWTSTLGTAPEVRHNTGSGRDPQVHWLGFHTEVWEVRPQSPLQ